MTDSAPILIGFSVSAVAGALKIIGNVVGDLPKWMDCYCLPGAVILGLSYVCIHLWRDGKDQRDARIKDRDDAVAREEARLMERKNRDEAMLRATFEQTAELKALRQAIEDSAKTE